MRRSAIQGILGLEGEKLENQERVDGDDVLESSQHGLFAEDSRLDEGGGFIRCP